nr:aminotransferase class V-fold PLP-dependent enzyme [Palleronia marisminoris]
MIYADYVASGRALAVIEDFVRASVLPYYSNTHTQASFCGSYMTRLREAARGEIARLVGADATTSVIFTGSGTTAAINRLVGLLGLSGSTAEGSARVLVGPYEHHSNILPWREAGIEVTEIAEAAAGGIDIDHLEAELNAARRSGVGRIVGAFSAASNVTGVLADVDAVTRLLRRHGAISVWDYGCAAPYVDMNMKIGTDAQKDAIVYSPHKFPGGPAASGIAVIRDEIVRRKTPTSPGGGTVSFVSPWNHVYSSKLSDREEGGTPNIVGDIRAALAMLVKEALGQDWLNRRHDHLRAMALAVWSRNPYIEILGMTGVKALPIFSFRVRDGSGGYVHHQLFTRMLSDLHGVQARGGCACAGPYAHRLLEIDEKASTELFAAISQGDEIRKPGWIRLNLSALLTDEKADTIVQAVDRLAASASNYTGNYKADHAMAQFKFCPPESMAVP